MKYEVSEERLRDLLATGNESDELDYKETLDLSNRSEVVEFAKDVGAFRFKGGHIIVGATENGSPGSRFSKELAKKFDLARVGEQLATYLPVPLEIQLAQHEIDNKSYVLIHIMPSAEGFTVFRANGEYEKKNGEAKIKKITVFRKGDVFAREGTRSERWQQHHVAQSIERIVSHRKERWMEERRREMTEILRAQGETKPFTTGPHTALSWTLDSHGFENTLIELIRSKDDVPVTLLLERLPPEARTRLLKSDQDGLADFHTVLDRIASIASLGIRLNRHDLVDQAVQAFASIYEMPHEFNQHHPIPCSRRQIWLDIAWRVYSLGALAVRKKDWLVLKKLALHPTYLKEYHVQQPWLFHARCEGDSILQQTKTKGHWRSDFISRCLNLAKEGHWLLADIGDQEDLLLNSLVQFDFLVAAIIQSNSNFGADGPDWFPNFAFFESSRIVPACLMLIVDQEARTQLLEEVEDHSVASLIRVLRDAAKRAVGFNYPLREWQSPAIEDFLARFPKDNL